MPDTPLTPIEIGLTAAIVTVEDEEPAILVAGARGGHSAKGEPRAGLPFGPFDPLAHRTFEIGLRAFVEAQTALTVGYVEQLYTFGDRGRHAHPGDTAAHMVSIGYLALTRMPDNATALRAAGFEPWYRFFPWEDWREARRDGREAALARDTLPALGEPMRFDHRRILATAIARLRAKLKYRPVVFELMPREFTLTELQRTVEAISGRRLHKQNFRRLVETAALVEPTGETSTATGGRPAARFRFRREVLAERPAAGLRFGGRA